MNDDIDERLAAWLDGALSPEEAAAFEAELEANPELAERAANWQANDRFIAGALAPIGEAPVDDALLARLGLAAPEPAPVANLLAANDNPPWWRRHALPLGGAIAASLVAVMILTTQAGRQRPDDLSLALETTPSLQQVRLADGRTVQPTLTVRAADGRWCREYRIGQSLGLACREDGRWKVKAEAGGSGPDATEQIGLAAGADASSLDAAYKRLGASDPLGAEAEAGAIRNRWDHR